MSSGVLLRGLTLPSGELSLDRRGFVEPLVGSFGAPLSLSPSQIIVGESAQEGALYLLIALNSGLPGIAGGNAVRESVATSIGVQAPSTTSG